MTALISRDHESIPINPARKNKVAVFGEPYISKSNAKLIASALVSILPKGTVVYTIKTDVLGKAVRAECKARGTKTYYRSVSHPSQVQTLSSCEELAVAGLAWKAGTFICVKDSKVNPNEGAFATHAAGIGKRMHSLVNCKYLRYEKLIK